MYNFVRSRNRDRERKSVCKRENESERVSVSEKKRERDRCGIKRFSVKSLFILVFTFYCYYFVDVHQSLLFTVLRSPRQIQW